MICKCCIPSSEAIALGGARIAAQPEWLRSAQCAFICAGPTGGSARWSVGAIHCEFPAGHHGRGKVFSFVGIFLLRTMTWKLAADELAGPTACPEFEYTDSHQ